MAIAYSDMNICIKQIEITINIYECILGSKKLEKDKIKKDEMLVFSMFREKSQTQKSAIK